MPSPLQPSSFTLNLRVSRFTNSQPTVRHSSQSEGGSTIHYPPLKVDTDERSGGAALVLVLPIEAGLTRINANWREEKGADAATLNAECLDVEHWTSDFGSVSAAPSFNFQLSTINHPQPRMKAGLTQIARTNAKADVGR
jgi:hypothetical protein